MRNEEPRVIYEDGDFLVIDKPVGLLVHEARGVKHETKKDEPKKDVSSFKFQDSRERTLADWLLARYPEIRGVGDKPETRPGIVHRLDRGTSGVTVIARNQKAFDHFKALFKERKIKKTYLALVLGEVEPRAGIIDKPIKIKSGTTKRTIHKGKAEKEAVTEYKVIEKFKNQNPKAEVSLLEIHPKTGRTHQIRAHLASIGHPVVGDRLYGPGHSNSKSSILAPRLMLHAKSLEFTDANGRRFKFEVDPPDDFKRILNNFLVIARR